MKAETLLYFGSLTLIVIVFGALLAIEIDSKSQEQIDTVYFDQNYLDNRFAWLKASLDTRFDRVEAGLVNSSVDPCFQSNGSWITDNNALRWIDLTENVEASLCARQKQEVQQ